MAPDMPLQSIVIRPPLGAPRAVVSRQRLDGGACSVSEGV
jgi:hypothetical protein